MLQFVSHRSASSVDRSFFQQPHSLLSNAIKVAAAESVENVVQKVVQPIAFNWQELVRIAANGGECGFVFRNLRTDGQGV